MASKIEKLQQALSAARRARTADSVKIQEELSKEVLKEVKKGAGSAKPPSAPDNS